MAINNSIEKIKNYVGDPSNLYAVFRAAALTTDLETPMIQFVGAKTMSYPVFPKSTTDMEDYDPTTGYSRVSATLVRKEATVSQDKGYQNAIDELDLQDSGTTAISYINNNVRQKDVPTVDKYRLNVLGGSGHYSNDGAATNANALALYDKAAAYLVDNEYPLEGTILYCTTAFYGTLKDSSRIYRSLGAEGGNIDRNIEMLDKTTKVVVIPAGRMPVGVQFILVQPKAVVCGVKHSVQKVITDPEDFDGILINRRLVHDCIVQDDRADGIYVSGTKAADASLKSNKTQATPTAEVAKA